MMDKIFYLITEGIKNTWRHKVTAFTAIFSLFISLYIIGIITIAGDNSYKILQYLRSKYKIEVFFNEDLTNEEAIGVIHKIKKVKGVKTATLIDKEDALRIFKDQFGESIIELLGYNPLPASSVVNVDRNIRKPLKIEPIIQEIKSMKYVDEVKYQGNLIRKIERNYKRVADYIPYFSGITILIVGLIIYNMIKVSIYSRRETIKSLQIIGATRIFIKLPFIFEGILISLISVFLVSPALVVTVKGANYILGNFTAFSINAIVDYSLFLWLLTLVVSISIIASYRAASSFLK